MIHKNKNECEFIPRSRECDPMPRIGQAYINQAQNKYQPSINQALASNVKNLMLKIALYLDHILTYKYGILGESQEIQIDSNGDPYQQHSEIMDLEFHSRSKIWNDISANTVLRNMIDTSAFLIIC